jgi:transcriptional regulator with PAS, ATPase and Fis domain
VSETLLLADLSGHVCGAFTGADRDRVGLFETAAGGTLLLDEIGDLPLPVQGALLRVLQEGEIRRVGESRVRKVDVRVIAATHRDLERMAGVGEFRQDLFFRLGAGTVTLPSLRERPGDVIEIAEHLLQRDSAKRLSTAAREVLVRHPWPGNVRELENVLRVASTLAAWSPVIRTQHLPLPAVAATLRPVLVP